MKKKKKKKLINELLNSKEMPSRFWQVSQCRIHNFHLGGAGNDQIKKSNNEINFVKVFLRSF